MQRLSEMCCIAVSQLLILGKSVIQNANKSQDADEDEDIVKIDWPEDSIDKAKTIRMKTQSMTGYLEEVAISFVTGVCFYRSFLYACNPFLCLAFCNILIVISLALNLAYLLKKCSDFVSSHDIII